MLLQIMFFFSLSLKTAVHFMSFFYKKNQGTNGHVSTVETMFLRVTPPFYFSRLFLKTDHSAKYSMIF